MNVGIVIPAYNEGKTLENVLSQVLSYVPAERIYVVDDGSGDETAEAAKGQRVNLLQHPENRGKGEALKTGFRSALADGCGYVLTLDGDGQHEPDMIPVFIGIAEKEDSDLIVGCRKFTPGTMPLDRILSNSVSSFIVSGLAGCRIPDSQCGYRMIKADVLQAVDLRSGKYELETELLIKAVRKGYSISCCDVPVIYNDNNSSNIRRFQDTYRFCRLCLRLLFNMN